MKTLLRFYFCIKLQGSPAVPIDITLHQNKTNSLNRDMYYFSQVSNKNI